MVTLHHTIIERADRQSVPRDSKNPDRGTSAGAVEVMATITALEKKYSRLFLRCHQSYLVNPQYIRNIRRFKVTLTDSTELPIPEKKYTAFRNKAIESQTAMSKQ